MSDIKIGLPTITFGPAKAAAVKEHAFSGNITDNSASLSFEIDPIETRDFHNSLLTPTTVGVIGILLQNFPKELVFHLLIDSVRFSELDGTTVEYRNDPTAPSSDCPAVDYETYDSTYTGKNIAYVSPYHPPGEGRFADLTNCKYQRFVYWIEAGISYGLSVEYTTIPNPRYEPSDSKSTQPKTILSGRFCLDPAEARPDLAGRLKGLPTVLCEQKPKKSPSATPPGKQRAHANARPAASPPPAVPAKPSTPEDRTELAFPFTRGAQVIPATLGIRTRSLMAAFIYLGKLLRAQDLVQLYSAEAQSNGDRRLLTVEPASAGGGCFAYSEADSLCVPYLNADNTKRIFSMLAELIQLNSAASDTPTSLTVRLTP